VELAKRVAQRVDEADDLERRADVRLNVVCFRYRPAGVPEDELDALNRRLARPCSLTDVSMSERRHTEADVDLLIDVIRELGASLVVAQQH
jgi:glutamate/tyrosine decarboxylase-like PLP-dependent enzyme